MSARHANRRESICCDSVGCWSICISPCQRVIEQSELEPGAPSPDAPRAGASRAAPNTGFALGCGIPRRTRPADGCMVTSGLTNDADFAVVAPGARRESDHLARCARASRTSFTFFYPIHFRVPASGRLSTAMNAAGHREIQSTALPNRALDCADVSDCAGSSTRAALDPRADKIARSGCTRSDRRSSQSNLETHRVRRGAPVGSKSSDGHFTNGPVARVVISRAVGPRASAGQRSTRPVAASASCPRFELFV